MTAYYNEFEPYAAEWLRNLIKKGLIADGIVDDRSITSVEASDLGDFTQCHFFAGIAAWSHALRLAGWPDDRPVWTGSCPCQPFSAAGKGKGFDDERHLWPEFHRLISECRPPVVFGEQVASKDGLAWLDTVQSDMEASGYAIGAADLCAAGIGAPHIRQRLWFVGERLDDTAGARHLGALIGAEGEARDEARLRLSGEGRGADRMADADSEDQRGRGIQRPGQGNGPSDGSARERPAGLRADGGLAHHHQDGRERSGSPRLHERRTGAGGEEPAPGGADGALGHDADGRREDGRPRPTNGHWRDADWLHCRDGKWRPVEPGTFPLAHGAPARVGRLRAYGNAIVGQAAKEIIAAYMECRP